MNRQRKKRIPLRLKICFCALSTFSVLLLSLLLLSSCTSFQGPGAFQSGPGAVEEEEPTTSPGPTLTLRGERSFSPSEDAIHFDWPLDEARLTRGFFLGRRSHWGVDLANDKGTPILASERGMVIYTGRGFRGYGNLIVIEHNAQWATLYSHLDKILIKEGQTVEQGQKIATMGRTGRASGVHLHFEIRHNRQPVNPLTYLPQGMGAAAIEDTSSGVTQNGK